MMRPTWIATPPVPYRSSAPAPVLPYQGPPSYRGNWPRWGFPPVVWQPATPAATPALDRPRLGMAITLCVLAAIGCLVAAGAETWRFALMVRGRTEVLSAVQVDTSDSVERAAALTALLTGGAAAVAVLWQLGRCYQFAAQRAGVRPPRDDAARLIRLLVPVFNLLGAGQVLAETDQLLRHRGDPDGRPARRVMVWWIVWVVNGVLVLALLWRRRMAGPQAAADSVELQIVVDLAAAAVAGLTAWVLLGFRRLITDDRTAHRRWVVLPPAAPAAVHEPAAVTAEDPSATSGPSTTEPPSTPDEPAPEDGPPAADKPDPAADRPAVSLVKQGS